MLEFGTFARAVNDRPYKWMTIGGQKKDGDCHEVVRYFIAMTDNRQIPIYRAAEKTDKRIILYLKLS